MALPELPQDVWQLIASCECERCGDCWGAMRAAALASVNLGFARYACARRAGMPQLPALLWQRVALLECTRAYDVNGGKRARRLAILGHGFRSAMIEHPDLVLMPGSCPRAPIVIS